VRPKVDHKAGQLSLPHVTNNWNQKKRIKHKNWWAKKIRY